MNHEKSIGVDNACANLAIKYNMLYISAYQVIKDNITKKTAWGKKLEANRSDKKLNANLNVADNFQEAQYSAVHYNLQCVMELLKETVSSKKTNQKFVLLEGLCNSQKLSNAADQLELRFMDEIFSIESIFGEVKAVIGLQFAQELEYIREADIEYEKFDPKPVEVAKPPKGEGEEEEEEEPPAEEEGEKPVKKFDPSEF